LEPVPVESFRRDVRVIGVVGVAHAISHFLQLALPPLFPLLRAQFDVSWTLLGTLVGVFYIASGAIQFTAGFLVDRFGARPILLSGMALLACGTLARSRSCCAGTNSRGRA
jgi:MFS family permease